MMDFLPWQQAPARRWLATRERFAHAWLIHGRPGCGQMEFALAGAASLLCESPRDGLACGACQACRWVAPGNHPDLRRIRPDVAAALQWEPVEVRAGETLWFHSRTPHRSGPNTSPVARRALYPTYNARSEGDLREDYYREKLAAFARRTAEGEHTGVSLIGDFQGRPVP